VWAIATLGPEGTSSEQAALHLWKERGLDGAPDIQLYGTYEDAGEALRNGKVSHLLVANAYAGVNSFYMDPGLSLEVAFVLDTPMYGIAVSPGHRIPSRPRIATHPAPVPLIDELLPAQYTVSEVLFATSTSAAAEQASRRDTDLALTTEPAARAMKLEFISRTRTIRMLWSVFTLATAH
jgi:prephenate dehydratase